MSEHAPDRSELRVPATAIGRVLQRIEIGLLAVLFIALVVLGLTQIGLRNLADSALPWADAAMRAAVLWLAMLSAGLAASEARHIRIDVLSRYLPPAVRGWVERVLFVLTALVCAAMTVASIRIVLLEYEFADLAFPGVPRWFVLAIVPFGFAVMCWRFLRQAFGRSVGPRPEPVPEPDPEGPDR